MSKYNRRQRIDFILSSSKGNKLIETFSNQINLRSSLVSVKSKLWGGLQFFIIHFKMHLKIINFINFIFYKDANLVVPYKVIMTVP